MTSSGSDYFPSVDSERELSAVIDTQVSLEENGSVSTVTKSIGSGCNGLVELFDAQYDQQQFYADRTVIERNRIKDLRMRLKRDNDEIENRRKFSAASYTEGCRGISLDERNESNLDRKLQLSHSRVNETEHLNEQLKEQIDSLRRQKVIESKFHHTVEENLSKLRADTDELTKRMQLIDNQRQEIRQKSESMRLEVLKNFQSLHSEYGTIMKQQCITGISVQESNSRLENQIRMYNSLIKSDGLTKHQAEISNIAEDHFSDIRQKSLLAYWNILLKKQELSENECKILELEDELQSISTELEPKTIDELVLAMITDEDESYKLFKLTNELYKELNELKSEGFQIQESLASLGIFNNGLQQKSEIEFQNELAEINGKTEEHEKMYRIGQDVVKSMEKPLISIFNRLFPPESDVANQEMMVTLDDVNLLRYLSLIENEIEHIIQLQPEPVADHTISNSIPLEWDPNTGNRVPSLSLPEVPGTETIEKFMEKCIPSLNIKELKKSNINPLNVAEVTATIKDALLPSA